MMSDHNPNKPNKPLSEISHLFLSSIRERQTNGQPPPQRKPPGSFNPNLSIDLTPEEFAQVLGEQEPSPSDAPPPPNVTAIIGAHLNGKLFDRVKQYAAHMASQHQRVGLIEVDACEFRLMLFERTPHGAAVANAEPAASESLDPHRMAEALAELSWDVQRWVLLLPNPKVPEARALLREVDQWVLLSTCDHDGVISCYRTLKGLADLHRIDDAQRSLPRLSLALFDVADELQSSRVSRKLSSVCQQFLHWPVDPDPAVVQPHHDVAEHLVICCRATRDKAQLAAAPQWQIVRDFLARSRHDLQFDEYVQAYPPESAPQPAADAPAANVVADIVVPNLQNQHRVVTAAEPAPSTQPMSSVPPMMTPVPSTSEASDVIDLPSGGADPEMILSAILRSGGEWAECAIKPPMCPDARLAVGRDRRLVMLAVAREGLADLRPIGRGYQWLTENRGLIAMALPQCSIDAHSMPRLHLIVDQSDMSAETLQPMLESGNVKVQAYRKLRWGEKLGLLLEAA
jgi:hypothetical protein